jgi:tetratricopeptide (TPR) repeat protein
VDASPQEFDAWHLLGFAQAGRGRHLEALDAYDRALSLKPSDPMAQYNRAVSLQALERWSDAAASYDLALDVRPSFPEALNNRGNVLRGQRKLRDALASFDAALALRPDYFEALSNRAMALQELRRRARKLCCRDFAAPRLSRSPLRGSNLPTSNGGFRTRMAPVRVAMGDRAAAQLQTDIFATDVGCAGRHC